MISCKGAPRGGASWGHSPALERLSKSYSKPKPKAKPKPKPKFRHPNKNARVLCRHKELTFYDDGTFRSKSDNIDNLPLSQCRIVPFPETEHNMFFYKHYYDGGYTEWMTDYNSNNEHEIALGNTVTRAMVNHEMKKVLTGGYDEAEEAK